MIKKFVKAFLFVLLVICQNLNSTIIESKSIQEVFDYAQKDSLIVFDLDSTVGFLENGIEYWVEHKLDELKKKGLNPEMAYDLVLCEYFVLSPFAKFLPIDNSPSVIRLLQKMGTKTIALTNRSIPVYKTTIKNLKKMDIDFSKNSLNRSTFDLAVTHNGIYSKGIIFAGKNDKGKMLYAFLDKIKYRPKKIIFVDDMQKNVISVQKEFEEGPGKAFGCEFIGLRDGFMDEAKKNFDPISCYNTIKNIKIQVGLEPAVCKK